MLQKIRKVHKIFPQEPWESDHVWCHPCKLSCSGHTQLLQVRSKTKGATLHSLLGSAASSSLPMLSLQASGKPMGFSGGAGGKVSACRSRRYKRCRFHPWVGKIPWNGKWHSTPVKFWAEELGRLQSMGLQRVGHDRAQHRKTNRLGDSGHKGQNFLQRSGTHPCVTFV